MDAAPVQEYKDLKTIVSRPSAVSGVMTHGYHECCVVDRAHERDARVLSWIDHGLEAGELLVHVEPSARRGAFVRLLEREGTDADSLVREGQLLVRSPEEAYLVEGRFEPRRRMAGDVAFVEQAVTAGYTGVRLSVDASLGLSMARDRAGMLAHERSVEELCAAYPASALCLYDRTLFRDSLGAYSRAHPRAVRDRLVRAYAEPGRVTLLGEVDVSNSELVEGLIEAAVPPSGDIAVEMAGLEFIDVRATAELVRIARRIGPARRLSVLHPPKQLRVILDVAGWEGALDVQPDAAA